MNGRMSPTFQDQYASMFPGKGCKCITFIVTHDCNLRCTYCYEHNKSGKRMSLETAKRCIDLLFSEDEKVSAQINSTDAHGLILDFIGGEPLLEVEMIDQAVDYFRRRAMELGHRWAKQYMVNIGTNGMLYFDEAVQRFIAKNSGRISVSITVDGDQKTHDACRIDCQGCGSFERADEAFFHVQKVYHQSGTKFTIAPSNVGRVYEACRDIIERHDLRELFCNCVFEEGWNSAFSGELYSQLKRLAAWLIDSGRYRNTSVSIFEDTIGQPLPETETQNWCGGTGKMLAFDVDGTVYPCLRYAPLSIGNRPPLRIGDIEHGIGVLPGDRATVDMLNSITRQSQSSEKCLSCPIASGCGWCSGYNYEVFGTPNKRATFICPTHKARVMAASYYWNRIHRLEGDGERFPLNIPREWAVPIVGEEEYEMLLALSKK